MKTKRTMKSIAAAALAMTLVAAPAVQELSPLLGGTSVGIVANAAEYSKTVSSDGDLAAYAANMTAGNTYTITLGANITDQLVVPAGVTVILNLGAYTLTNDDTAHSVELEGTSATYSDAITNFGTLTIDATTGGVASSAGGQSALCNMPGGNVTINKGTFTGSGGQYVVNNLGTMTVEDGTFTAGATGTAIHNGWIGSSSVATNHGTDWAEGMTSTLTVKDGTLSGGKYAVSGGYGSSIEVKGGDLNGSAYTAMNYGQLTISGGTLAGAGDGILSVDPTGEMGTKTTVTGGTFQNTGAAVAIGAAGIPNTVPVAKTEISGGNFECKIIDSATGGNGGGSDPVTTDQLEITGSNVNIVISGGGDEAMAANGTDLLEGLIKDGVTVTVTTDVTDPDAVVAKVCGNHDVADKTFKFDADGHYFECDNCGEAFYITGGNRVAGKAAHTKAQVTNDAGEAAAVEWTYDADGVPTNAVQKIKCANCSWTGTEEATNITYLDADDTPEAGKTTRTYTANFSTGPRAETCPQLKIIDTAEVGKQALLNEARDLLNTNVNTNGIDSIYPEVVKGDTDSILTKALQLWIAGQSSLQLSDAYGDAVTVTFTGAAFSDPDTVNPGKLTGTITLTLKADTSYTTTLAVDCEYGADADGFDLDGAKTLVENWLAGKTEDYLKSTTGAQMVTDLNTDIPALGSNSFTVSLTSTTEASTLTTEGKVTITGTVTDISSSAVAITPVEIALPVAVKSDAEKAADVKPIVNAYLEAMAVTKDTTSETATAAVMDLADIPDGVDVAVTVTITDESAVVSAVITAGDVTETIDEKTKPVGTASSGIPGDTDGNGIIDMRELRAVISAYEANR